jgi:hypothetical protein
VRVTPEWVEAIGTWVGGLGTMGALLAALAALSNERKTRAEEMKRFREQEHLVRRAQARSIVLHNDHIDYRQPVPDSAQAGSERVYRVTLGNYSEYPINAVVATIHAHRQGEDPVTDFPKFIPVLRANESIELEWPLVPEFLAIDGLPELPKASSYKVDLMFVDVHGLTWETGKLQLAKLAEVPVSQQPGSGADKLLTRVGLLRRLQAAVSALRGS